LKVEKIVSRVRGNAVDLGSSHATEHVLVVPVLLLLLLMPHLKLLMLHMLILVLVVLLLLLLLLLLLVMMVLLLLLMLLVPMLLLLLVVPLVMLLLLSVPLVVMLLLLLLLVVLLLLLLLLLHGAARLRGGAMPRILLLVRRGRGEAGALGRGDRVCGGRGAVAPARARLALALLQQGKLRNLNGRTSPFLNTQIIVLYVLSKFAFENRTTFFAVSLDSVMIARP
jgi:hypothetical protein